MSNTPPGSPTSNQPWNPSLTPQLQPVEYVQCPPFYPVDAHESRLHLIKPQSCTLAGLESEEHVYDIRL
jgi:hypothetical protein